MREIHENIRPVEFSRGFQPAADRLHGTESPRYRLRTDSQNVRARRRRKCIIYVMSARHRQGYAAQIIRQIEHEFRTVKFFRSEYRKRFRGSFQSVIDGLCLSCPVRFRAHGSDFPTRLVVAVEHRDRTAFGGKKQFLGLLIIFHRLEKVEVILREVRKNTSGKGNSFLLPIKQRMGGNFRHHVFHAAFEHIRKHFMQKNRVGRGEFGRDLLFSVIDTERPPHRHGFSRAAQNGGEHIRSRRLSVGSRDADDFQLIRGVAVKSCGHQAHGGARIGNDDLRNFQFQFPFRDRSGGTRELRIPRKGVGIRLSAREAKEQISRRTEPTVCRETFYLRILRHLHIFLSAYDPRALHAAGKFR